jgi:fumarylacetoacetase
VCVFPKIVLFLNIFVQPEEFGSMLELAWKGTKPVKMKDGTERKFIADGDIVEMGGVAHGPNFVIGFGECTGVVLPALKL